MSTFLPNPIENIIISYLNLHEYYIEELINKTRFICEITGTTSYHNGVCSIAMENNSLWTIIWGTVACPKTNRIKKLNERVNNRNKILGIVETDRYGTNNNRLLATNLCYINY